jgi:hypothetical protein
VRALERLTGTRIVSTPEVIDSTVWPRDVRVFRLAPDEVFVDAAIDPAWIDDADAIVVRETGFSGVWMERSAAIDFLQRECDWELPGMGQWGNEVPAFAQGLVAGLPVKVWFEADRVLFFVASPLAQDFAERLR